VTNTAPLFPFTNQGKKKNMMSSLVALALFFVGSKTAQICTVLAKSGNACPVSGSVGPAFGFFGEVGGSGTVINIGGGRGTIGT
jgi:hypothetical protein